ncbi:MAG: thioesterase family protein [Candidatus Competibacteraceae bacterium]|nr:thioesterase family protein [Candidatus Competibacteraceae bacterium]MBK7983658.1 thioesterase family protein [Candidatus Competibacteraceae bacterium]MBK8897800.1 thioesterase family protein [Candidatus Competibacteraceae bacterium]MBK8961606.1 thioesterase family protein [Candidatus Competibacteraceae bacterium]MBK9950831.1 thioesterase family protein [Candidatus Competibacteraceae bacterium]
MARIKLELPAGFPFSTDLPIRITDINYAGHLGNDGVLGLLHEARFRFMAHHGLQELKVEGLGLIITDSAIVYKSEAFAGETLTVAVTVADFNKYGCDFVYRVTEKRSGREVAHAKTGIVFFDYEKRTVQKIPQSFLDLFPDAAPV